MRILIVSPVFPAPLDTGTRVRLANLIRQFHAQGHETGLICFITPGQEQYAPPLASLLADLRLIRTGISRSFRWKLRRFLGVLPLLARGVPRLAAFAKHPEVQAALEDLAPHYDAVLIDFYFMGYNVSEALLRARKNALSLVEQDISFIPLQRRYMVCKGLARLKAGVAFLFGKRAETAMLRRFSHIIAMSDKDAALLSPLAPAARVTIAPNGVDCASFSPTTQPPPRQTQLLFVGGMEHYPNLDAVRFFTQNILPLIRQKIPDATLLVAGTTGKADVSSLRGEHVAFADFVPDLRPQYAKSLALVCPFRIGGGTRLKILEGLACNIPVISTAIGAEGLRLENGKHILLADSPAAFSDAVYKLYTETKTACALSTNGRLLVAKHYDWQNIAASLVQSLINENPNGSD